MSVYALLHTRGSRQHYHDEELPSESVLCGYTVKKRTRRTNNWRKVDCGNCIAIHAQGLDDSPEFIPDGERGAIYADMGGGGTLSYWEKVDVLGYVLDRTGQRMSDAPACLWEQVEATYGPLHPATLEEIRFKWLDVRLAEGNL